MRTITAQSILEGVLRREGGGNLASTDATAAEVARFFDYIADRLRTAWEYFPWLETFAVEKRYFRAVWASGSTYVSGDEVYFIDSTAELAYYVASATTSAGESPETTPSKWTVMTAFRRQVEFEQTGQTAFEGVAEAYAADPLSTLPARPIAYNLTGDGLVVTPEAGEIDYVWLKIIKKCEDFAAVLWVVGDAYAAGRRIYYATTGECYRVVTTTTAGETPVSAAAKFVALEFPYILGRAVKSGALADWQRSDGAADKAAAEETQFYRLLDEQKWKLIATQGQRGRIRFSA